jgi:uncharacterized protein YcfL
MGCNMVRRLAGAAVVIGAFALTGCNSEVRAAEREIDTIRASQAKASLGFSADNAQLCTAYRRLEAAHLKAGNADKLAETRIHVVAYCN